MAISLITANVSNSVAFKKSNKIVSEAKKEEKTEGHVKKEGHHHAKVDGKVVASTLAGAAVAIAGAVSAITMMQKGKENRKFFQQLIKNDYEELQVIGLGGASILGGLVGGVLSDKKETHKSKAREAMLQFFGNFVAPVSLLAGVRKALENSLFKKGAEETLLRTAGKAGVVVATLLIGTKLGNMIMQPVNNKIFKENKKRDMCLKDLSASVDDMGYSLPFISNSPIIKTWTPRLLPFIFFIPGYETGTKQ